MPILPKAQKPEFTALPQHPAPSCPVEVLLTLPDSGLVRDGTYLTVVDLAYADQAGIRIAQDADAGADKDILTQTILSAVNKAVRQSGMAVIDAGGLPIAFAIDALSTGRLPRRGEYGQISIHETEDAVDAVRDFLTRHTDNLAIRAASKLAARVESLISSLDEDDFLANATITFIDDAEGLEQVFLPSYALGHALEDSRLIDAGEAARLISDLSSDGPDPLKTDLYAFRALRETFYVTVDTVLDAMGSAIEQGDYLDSEDEPPASINWGDLFANLATDRAEGILDMIDMDALAHALEPIIGEINQQLLAYSRLNDAGEEDDSRSRFYDSDGMLEELTRLFDERRPEIEAAIAAWNDAQDAYDWAADSRAVIVFTPGLDRDAIIDIFRTGARQGLDLLGAFRANSGNHTATPWEVSMRDRLDRFEADRRSVPSTSPAP